MRPFFRFDNTPARASFRAFRFAKIFLQQEMSRLNDDSGRLLTN
jgi:hypothetical protein